MMKSRSVSNRILWKMFGPMLVASALFVADGRRAETAARLTLDWMDNTGGTANFIIERKTGTTGTYARITTPSPGITTYVDSTVAAGTTYCYRVKASNALGDSGYSNEGCKTIGNEQFQQGTSRFAVSLHRMSLLGELAGSW